MNKSIFDNKNKIQSGWVKWEKIGYKIEGTLISKKVIYNQSSKKDQVVYEIKTPENEYWLIGGRPVIDYQMQKVKLGQIVGFEYTEQKKPTRPGLSGVKMIQVYADPSIVDKNWLQQQEEEAIARGSSGMGEEEESADEGNINTDSMFDEKKSDGNEEEYGEEELEDTVEEDISEEEAENAAEGWVSNETKKTETKEELLKKITKLATKKLGVTTATALKEKVMEATGLAFINSNLDKIIDALEELPAKKKTTKSK